MTIQQAENEGKITGFALVTDELEVNQIINYLGRKRFANSRNISGLFIGDTSTGDYSNVYGFSGNVPYNNKELYKIK